MALTLVCVGEQVSLSNDLRKMTVICSGVRSGESLQIMAGSETMTPGLYAISVDTSLLGDRCISQACLLFFPELHFCWVQCGCIKLVICWLGRRKELRQVALQASSVEELLEVVQSTVSVMHKHWNEAISSYDDKFRPLSALLLEHGMPVSAVNVTRSCWIQSEYK